MLTLAPKAEVAGWAPETHQLKVAGLADFASGLFPPERMLLDLRSIAHHDNIQALIDLPWAGFLVNRADDAPIQRPHVRLRDDQNAARPGDVVEIQPQNGKIFVRYRRGAKGNVLFATERCNSYCLMCSQPPRAVDDDWRVTQLCELVELIDPDEPNLAISGGEPTLLGIGLARLISHCAERLPDTKLHVLSNGRNFATGEYAEEFRAVHPALSWGIPFYGDHYALHDYVVQKAGAFSETVRGLYALEQAQQRIEIRIVLVRPTVERLVELSRFIYRCFPFVEHVALMGVEPIGFAKANRDAIWVDPSEMREPLTRSVEYLAERGVPISIYNLPLCVLPESLRPFARRSISDWKQDYLPVCEPCALKDACGGFFSWTNEKWNSKSVAPVLPEESV